MSKNVNTKSNKSQSNESKSPKGNSQAKVTEGKYVNLTIDKITTTPVKKDKSPE